MIRFQSPQLPPVAAVAHYFAAAESARWYSNGGPCHDLLVGRLEDRLGMFCVPVANATSGLLLGIRALAIPGRTEVVLPSFTFAATVNAVRWAGLRPVFVDIDAQTWHTSVDSLEAGLRRPDVALALPCATFGLPPPARVRRRWRELSAAAGVPLLVDLAAAFGSDDDEGRPLGTSGDAEVFSFHATKPFAVGEGGLVVTGDARVAAQVRRLANFGFGEDGILEDGSIGLNAKMTEWTAATALAVLDTFGDVLRARRAAAAALLEAVVEVGLRPPPASGAPAWQFVPVRAATGPVRDRLLVQAAGRGVELRAYYRTPLHRMPAYAGAPAVDRLPATEDLAADVLSLPLANDFPASAVAAVAAALTGPT